MSAPRKLLIIDDSATARLALRMAVDGPGSDLLVAGEAGSRVTALRALERVNPDIITMDVHLGDEDGVELAAEIMATRATPILIVTGENPRDPALAFRAIEVGALDVLPKLPAPGGPEYEKERRRLVRVLTALSRVPVVTRKHRRTVPPGPPKVTAPEVPFDAERPAPTTVLIGASTGGPPAIRDLLSKLPAPYPAAIVIVQHIEPGFTRGFAEWLEATTSHHVQVCTRCLRVRPGEVYVAPDHAHLRFVGSASVEPQPGPPRRFYLPSIDELFQSASRHDASAMVGVLLTGMGSDGAEGLKSLREAGALTFVQQPTECAVSSMPENAIALGAVREVLTINEIAQRLLVARGGSSSSAPSVAASSGSG